MTKARQVTLIPIKYIIKMITFILLMIIQKIFLHFYLIYWFFYAKEYAKERTYANTAVENLEVYLVKSAPNVASQKIINNTLSPEF